MLLQQVMNDTDVKSAFEFFDKLGIKFFVRMLIDVISVTVLIRFVFYPIYN